MISMQTAAMPRYSLRKAPISSRDANPADDAGQADSVDNMCVICQERITDDQNAVTLRCCHRFHGQCLCDHLVHDGRCPICRDSPYADPIDYQSEEEEEEEEPRGMTVKEAIKIAKANRKKCKRTDCMLKTISKWRNERKDLRTRTVALYQQLTPMEDAIYKKVEEMEKKLFATLKRRKASLYDSIDKTRKEMSRARANYTSAQLRVAQKYGYERPSKRSTCRWFTRSDTQEEGE